MAVTTPAHDPAACNKIPELHPQEINEPRHDPDRRRSARDPANRGSDAAEVLSHRPAKCLPVRLLTVSGLHAASVVCHPEVALDEGRDIGIGVPVPAMDERHVPY